MQITILNGPHAGQERSSEEIDASGHTPHDLLVSLAGHGWRWSLHGWDDAGPEQAHAWLAADFAARLLLAAREHRGVRIDGTRWELRENTLADQLAELDAATDSDLHDVRRFYGT